MSLVIRQERIRRGWTQEYVAKQLGVSNVAVQYLETNQTKPSYPVLVKLEDLFGMTHRELFAVVDDTSNLSAQ